MRKRICKCIHPCLRIDTVYVGGRIFLSVTMNLSTRELLFQKISSFFTQSNNRLNLFLSLPPTSSLLHSARLRRRGGSKPSSSSSSSSSSSVDSVSEGMGVEDNNNNNNNMVVRIKTTTKKKVEVQNNGCSVFKDTRRRKILLVLLIAILVIRSIVPLGEVFDIIVFSSTSTTNNGQQPIIKSTMQINETTTGGGNIIDDDTNNEDQDGFSSLSFLSDSRHWWTARAMKDLARPFTTPQVLLLANNNNQTDTNNDVHSSWCVIPNTQKLSKPKDARKYQKWLHGILYIKSPKTASSTSAGVTLQIAHNVALRLLGGGKNNNDNNNQEKINSLFPLYNNNNNNNNNNSSSDNYQSTNLQQQQPLIETIPICPNHWSHGFAFMKGQAFRNPTKSLLWTTVRVPHLQKLSEYFHFLVSRMGQEPTDENIMNWLYQCKNSQVMYINTKQAYQINAKKKLTTQDLWVELLKSFILDSYDFIAVTERMDESLVAMKMLWNLEFADIIVLSTKQSGGYATLPKTHTCHKIIPASTSYGPSRKRVRNYLMYNHTVGNYDYMLYTAVNRSLDLTIDQIGKDLFAKELEEYRMLKRIVHERCLDRAIFPCSSNGTYQKHLSLGSCISGDSACGFLCVKTVFENE